MTRLTACSAAVLTIVLTAAGSTAAGAVAREPGGTGFSTNGSLFGVTATSASNAWAVGGNNSGTLILHWNGRSWAKVRSPGAADSNLDAVTATSASNAWAVGGTITANGSGNRALILHWNGTSWATVPSPAPAGSGLTAVSATSADDAWAVGSHGTSSAKSLILHWNGKAWARVPSPPIHPAGSRFGVNLTGVAATSAGSAWATGVIIADSSGNVGGLILHWNGKSWRQVNAGRVTASVSELSDVAAASARSAWTVGCACGGGIDGGVTGRWNGTSWKRVAIPVRALGSSVDAVTTAPAGRAWATGTYCAARCSSGHPVSKVLILHWTGSAWQKVASPTPRGTFLGEITAPTATSAWAVGDTESGKALILHWNGHTWS